MADRIKGITINVDIVTLHFKDGGTKSFKYIPAKQLHRKRKVDD